MKDTGCRQLIGGGGGLLHFHAACCRSDVAHCESAENAPTPQASASPDLMQVARNNTHNLTYLRELPARLLETVDVGLKTGTAILPVHRYVLVAYSPVFAEILAGDTARPSSLCIPVGDTSTEGLQDALQYIYNRCPLARANVPAITSFAEAERIAAAAHKFDIQLLLEASDAFMSSHLIAKYPILTKDPIGLVRWVSYAGMSASFRQQAQR